MVKILQYFSRTKRHTLHRVFCHASSDLDHVRHQSVKTVKLASATRQNDPVFQHVPQLKSVYPVIDNNFLFETSGDAYKIVKAGDDVEKQKVLSASSFHFLFLP